ncbi:calmin [Myripristis murdjan]|uniref:calmin n=1 Tax=Myripristis murdjan TaxID=586833 RepID=UPI0011761B1E|nr:calmin [Myripristis murdjan]
MAGHEWEDWFEREELIGQISDIRVQNLQVEREVVQKRTFTRWMNLHLEKCDPPIEVHDLFRDIQDGRILMALLEELSGCKLLHGFKKSSHRIFRLNNIAKVLSFLEERNVKLVSIDAADIADGNSSIILGLIWNIILFFQIKELTGNIRSQFPSSSSLSSIPTSSDSDASLSSTPSEERRPSSAIREHGKAIKKLLQWVQKRTRKYGVAVQDFGKSWTSGLAFLAVIKSIDSSLVDMRKSLLRGARENLEEAFRTAHYSLGIPRLLEPEDVTINSPDEQSIMTYVSQFLEHFPGIEEPEEPCQLIERSISMGRLSSRDSDFDQMRNGIHRGRLRGRPYIVRKDWVHPPPKIFISSMSEDRGAMSPTSPPVGARSWASVDSLAGSTPIDDKSPIVAGDAKDPGKQVFTISNSPTGSSVTESVNTESLIGDSAISSPDSWVESEVEAMPERFGQSPSDSSLCDSGTAWDVSAPPITPEEVTTLDEELMPSIVDRPSDKQSIPELYADEGIYSLSSLESTHERIQAHPEKEEEGGNILPPNQGWASKHEPGQNGADNKAEKDSEKTDMSLLQKEERKEVSSEWQPSVQPSNVTESASSGVKINESNQSQPFSNPKPQTPDLFEELIKQDSVKANAHKDSECAKDHVDLSGESQEHEGQLNVETKCLNEDKTSDKERVEVEISKGRGEDVIEISTTQDGTSQEILNGHTDPQENNSTQIHDAIASTHLTNQDRASSLDLSMDTNVPLTSISNDPTEEDKERTCAPQKECHAGDSGNKSFGIDVNRSENLTEKSCKSREHDDGKAPESTVCHLEGQLSDKVMPEGSKQMREVENGHLADINQHDIKSLPTADSLGPEASENMEISITQQKCGSPLDDQTPPVHSDQDIERNSRDQFNGHQDTLSPTFLVNKTAIAQQNRSDQDNLGPNVTKCYKPVIEAGHMDVFFTDVDRSSPIDEIVGDPVDPMDLFYPDKEEPMFIEPSDVETESHSSVLSVSALLPAPASETLPEAQPLIQLGEDVMNGVDLAIHGQQDKEITETDQGVVTPSEVQEHCSLPGEEMVGGRGTDRPAEGSDDDVTETQEQIPGSAMEIEPMRIETTHSRRQEDILIPTVLRHRKVACSTESMDNQTTVSASKSHDDSSDLGWTECSELYLLLLLWLLLYCVWLLPQMDLKTLPRLLLSLDL